MESRADESAREGVRCALDLFEMALEIQRRNYRREQPDASDDEIEQRLAAWLLVRRGAEDGDAEGRRSARSFGAT